jgi:hypothetical protein
MLQQITNEFFIAVMLAKLQSAFKFIYDKYLDVCFLSFFSFVGPTANFGTNLSKPLAKSY